MAAFLLTGCTFYKPQSSAWIACEGAQCTELWSAAQVWLAKNSRYRFQIVNDNIIQTHGPHENVFNGVAYTLTRETRGEGKAAIVITGDCYSTIYGCAFDPSPYVNALYYHLGGK